MKKYEMLPTEENIIETLYNDPINRNKDIDLFYNSFSPDPLFIFIIFCKLKNQLVQLQLMEDGEVVRLFLLDKPKWLSMH